MKADSLLRTVRNRSDLVIAVALIFASSVMAQKKDAEQFKKLWYGKDAIIVDGERLYRNSEVSQRAIVTAKPEPSYTALAASKKTSGTVVLFAAFKSTGKVQVLYVLKSLPNGLTEKALDAAAGIKFKPALLDARPVSQVVELEYNFSVPN